ncbi:alanine racemase [Amphibacillus cookii]|uniref:alanine racemase n=1 Tax=Amphibacillus cookii TaxID=767787 RepID=UPI001957A31F|nr:alanine racemase [Amphibacillus cookii]MBM7542895.1 alanine racemase [Amphibacillus cookii]
MEPSVYRQSWLSIDLSAIKNNIKQLRQQLANRTEIIAVVKANGYGHGDVQVAQAAIEAGATCLAVALLEEAVKLRKAGINVPILVMGWVSPTHASVAVAYDITLTIFQTSWLEAYYDQNLQKPLSVHIKLDTGMGRLGIRTAKELVTFIEKIDRQAIHVTGVFTHFATADEQELDYYQLQNQRFEKQLALLKLHYPEELVIHTGNSAAGMRHSADMFDAVRFGIGMYGLYPSMYMKKTPPFVLYPALTLQTQLTHVKQLDPGEGVSYGVTYRTKGKEWIGTLPIGYADGIQRKWQGLDVLVDGKRMPLVGRVCMDQCMVKLDRAYPIGTEVTFIGKQGNEQISLEEVAEHLGTINYEVSCLFTSRLPRYYN